MGISHNLAIDFAIRDCIAERNLFLSFLVIQKSSQLYCHVLNTCTIIIMLILKKKMLFVQNNSI